MTYFADKIIENKILKRTGIVDIGSNTITVSYTHLTLPTTPYV